MLRSLDLNTSVEHSAVHAFTAQTVARLSPVDSTLPQVLTICEMVKRGIGVVRFLARISSLACLNARTTNACCFESTTEACYRY